MRNISLENPSLQCKKSILSVLAVIAGIGVSGIGLAVFVIEFHRDRDLAITFLWVGGLAFVSFAFFGLFACTRETLQLLGPPLVNATLWLGTVHFVLFALVLYWLRFMFLIWAFCVTIRAAGDLVDLIRIPFGIRRTLVLTNVIAIIVLFEASSIFAFPYLLGLVIEVLETYGVKVGWS